MRNYDLYIIDELFINYYYGRERIFFDLFKDYKCTNSQSIKRILSRQIDYITKPIPSLRITQQIFQQLKKRKDFFTNDGMFIIENRKSSACLTINQKKCVLSTDGNIDAEMAFMEALRKTEYNFLAIDIENERFGWLKPMKEKHYI